MEPPRAAPLQIPSEDDVPLFDPSGLSASLSADDWHNSFDLSSVAAARLGIGSPPSQNGSGSLSASIVNLARSDSRNNTHSDTNATSNQQLNSSISRSSSNDLPFERQPLRASEDDAKRGRRRRSSAAHGGDDQPSVSVNPTALPQKDTSVGSKVRMWWERSAPGAPDVDSNDTPAAEHSVAPPALPSLQTDVKPTSADHTANTTFTSPTSMSPEISSSSVRSPAADFLSAFSSFNSVLQPSSSHDNRSLSYSPPRAGHRSLGASLMGDDIRNGSAAAPGFASLRGFGSAAAQLYDNKLTTAPQPPPRNDDEGARVGPSGRYLLGKTIGFGGFSTVREGWDLEAQGPADPAAPLVDGQPRGRKVAVKIVYHDKNHDRQVRDETTKQQHNRSQELHIWERLPTHPHLLPLLHHECVALDAPHAVPSHGGGTTADLLIMPFCDQGNLLDFVRSEGGAKSLVLLPTGEQPFPAEERRSGSGPWVAPSPTRSSSQLSRSSSLKNSNDAANPVRRYSSSRTGSGFILPRNLGAHVLGRVASVSAASQLRTIPAGQDASSVASSPASVAGSVSSGSRLIRRTNSQMPRSQGVPIDAAREIMRQLASALNTLHNKSNVLHGDLKLENVLGQDQTSWKKRQRMSSLRSDTGERSRQNSGSLADSIDSLAASSVSSRQTLDSEVVMPCWRVADFGLAQAMDPVHERAGIISAPALIRSLKQEADAENSTPKKGQRSGRGGSLAYTAPEYLRAQGRSGSSSPAAVESPAGDSDLPRESPFAADMWALGCIFYALLSGKLPFSDSFEPRLQMKIAKAQWELPPRLRRRAERLAASSTATLTSQQSQSNRNSVVERAGSVEPAGIADRFAFSQRSTSGVPQGRGSFGGMDLSASLPSLLPRERQPTEPATGALPRRSVAVHSDHVVGSAPGRADHLEAFEINEAAKARADIEEDPESDEDSHLDPAWDGLSWDRAAARQVLRGLLEPDPRRRWTIDKLCSSAWIRQEGGDPALSPTALPTKSLLGDSSALRSSHSMSASTTPGVSDVKGMIVQPEAWPSAVASAVDANFGAPSASAAADSPSFDGANVGEDVQRQERGRRSSSLARTRPTQLAHDSSSSASPARSPGISVDEQDSSKRRSRSTSRISFQYRDSSRNPSNDVSGSSTPSRDRDYTWMSHHLASSLNTHSHQWTHAAAKDRCDSPADSEWRGRMTRSRMADLDENTTWNGEDGTSSDSRAGSRGTSSVHKTGPIAIRGRSGSRSRSRHSGDSGSPERFAQRSISRSRSNYSLSHEAGGGIGGLLYGRSMEVQPVVGQISADQIQAQRSSTARSRSRAPDALAQILGRQRSRSRSRVRNGSEASRADHTTNRSAPSLHTTNSDSSAARAAGDDKVPTDSEGGQEARGRARDRR